MDDELKELEAELKQLRPLAPSPFLRARVEQAFAPPPRRTWLAWIALPAAAAVAALLLVRSRPVENPAAPAPIPGPVVQASTMRYKPVSADNVLYDERDEGLVTLADGSAARRYRTSYVDTITWRDPRTQASLRWSVPRTEERVVPVRFQ